MVFSFELLASVSSYIGKMEFHDFSPFARLEMLQKKSILHVNNISAPSLY